MTGSAISQLTRQLRPLVSREGWCCRKKELPTIKRPDFFGFAAILREKGHDAGEKTAIRDALAVVGLDPDPKPSP